MKPLAHYRPEIDGLRAIAVLSVVFFHAGLGCTGGYVGVDVFFVISGYLITSLLMQECQKRGELSLRHFWVRRIKRLLPALTVMVTLVWLLGLLLLLPQDMVELSQSLGAQSLLSSNIFFWKKTGYFGGAAERKPLLHTWSLAVEEQFYLVFPILIGWLYWRRKTTIPWVLAAGFFFSFVLSAYTYRRMPSACFYWLPTRAWELLLGSLLALFPGFQLALTKRWKEAMSWSGLTMIICCIWTYDNSTPFPGPGALIPCLGTALLLASNMGERTSVGEVLSRNPIRSVGLMSYSLYLWHWPVISYMNYYRLGEYSVATRLAAVGLMLILGWLSYSLVEGRFRAPSPLDKHALRFAAAGILWSLVLYGVTAANSGFPGRFSADVLRASRAAAPGQYNRDTSLEQVQKGDLVGLGQQGSAPKLFVWGDSHAMAVLPLIDRVGREQRFSAVAAVHNSMPPILGASLNERFSQLENYTKAYNQAVFNSIISSQASHVLLVGAWEDYFGRANFRDQLLETIRALRARNKSVWVLHEIPVHPVDVPHALAISKIWGVPLAGFTLTREQYLAYTHPSRQALATPGLGVGLLDPLNFFYPGQSSECRLESDGVVLYRDPGHLSTEGSQQLSEVVAPLTRELNSGR